jgi:hypothetical protein
MKSKVRWGWSSEFREEGGEEMSGQNELSASLIPTPRKIGRPEVSFGRPEVLWTEFLHSARTATPTNNYPTSIHIHLYTHLINIHTIFLVLYIYI